MYFALSHLDIVESTLGMSYHFNLVDSTLHFYLNWTMDIIYSSSDELYVILEKFQNYESMGTQ